MKNKKYKEQVNKLINLHIPDPAVKEWTLKYFKETVPEYFWDVPASTSGKYHPPQAVTAHGLIKHTLMALYNLLDIIRLDYAHKSWGITDRERSELVAAVLIHDTFKCGKPIEGADMTKHTMNDHELIPLEFIPKEFPIIYQGVAAHMGEWGAAKPECNFQFIVHLADYLASRKRFKKVAIIKNEYTGD